MGIQPHYPEVLQSIMVNLHYTGNDRSKSRPWWPQHQCLRNHLPNGMSIRVWLLKAFSAAGNKEKSRCVLHWDCPKSQKHLLNSSTLWDRSRPFSNVMQSHHPGARGGAPTQQQDCSLLFCARRNRNEETGETLKEHNKRLPTG